ncbi:Zinc metalloprotease (elastase) [Beggiatoa alba B18LD]|uniref:Zinc metalloprotease (Elastase) n=1 Tax=Beggiatoa alba B18LD TaxID=395493 RepID=I3CDR7_9GAMM|nr:M4 family metallopeptidase [Beggiatoa alba]EIJ41760.1 Zinc metalloprotease (elastase) [Beggiatoa alba B18LD]
MFILWRLNSLLLFGGMILVSSVFAEEIENKPSFPAIHVNPLHLPATPKIQANPSAQSQTAQTLLEQLHALKARQANPKNVDEGVRQVYTAETQTPIAKQADNLSTLSQQVGEKFSIKWRANGTPLQIGGGILATPLLLQGVDNLGKTARYEATARQFLRENRQLLRIDDPDKEFILQRQQTDSLQRTQLRFEQFYKNLPIYPAEIAIHLDSQGNVDLMNGAYIPTPRKLLATTPQISRDVARTQALARHVGKVSEPELIIYAPEDKTPQLAWRISIISSARENWLVVINALTGEIIDDYNQNPSANVQGTGEDLFNQIVALNLWADRGQYYLIDTSKPMFTGTPNEEKGSIYIYDLNGRSPDKEEALILVSSRNANSGFIPEGVSLAYHLSNIYNYYQQRYQRNSYDGEGASILGVVRMGEEYADNAFWNGAGLFFGNADSYAGSLDIIAHEFQHAVTQHTANLVYKNQSGALNEAYSDIFGEMLESYVQGRTDWQMGTSLKSGVLRDLINPNRLNAPATMAQYINTTEDNGGVHLNMTIVAHAFYLLADGLNNAIGKTDAERIFFRALNTYLTKNAQFIDARLATIKAADDLFGSNSPQSQKVAEAFNAVQIYDGQSTPDAPTYAPIDAPDATLSICVSGGNFFLCRRDPSLNDGTLGVYLTRFDVAPRRASVTANGTLAAFVDSIHDFCLIPLNSTTAVEERCLGEAGLIHSVAMSPDGNRYAFVLQDENGSPTNTITIMDIAQNSVQEYTIQAPATEGVMTNTILFADALDFTADGENLVYDALNILKLSDGEQVASWSIYALDLASTQIISIVPPVAGLDIGNPSLSQTSDNNLTFTATEPNTGISSIYAANLNTGELRWIGNARGEYSVASYTGDDTGIVFDTYDENTPTQFSLVYQAVKEKIYPQGELALWLKDASYGTVYRRGVTSTPTPTPVPTPPANNSPSAPQTTDAGTQITSDIWMKAEIISVEKGAINALWRLGGDSLTARGDRVIWGYFYANPTDVSWGSPDNPDLYVKIWFDVSGRIDVNFFHVSVPNINVYSRRNNGSYLTGTSTTEQRYVRHTYNPNNTQQASVEATQNATVLSTAYNRPNNFPTMFMNTQIKTEEKGAIAGLLFNGGLGQSARGDQVAWGYYYANPDLVTWGNANNPEVFYKIWWDVSGRIDVNFFHVSVPDIVVNSRLETQTNFQNSDVTLSRRYSRHEYTPR